MSTGQSTRVTAPFALFSGAWKELGQARWSESALLTGFVLIALPFTGALHGAAVARQAGLLLFASIALFSSIYSFNSYYGFVADRLNPRLSGRQLEAPRHYLARGLVTLGFSLALFVAAGPRLAIVAAAIFGLWVAYSVPGGAKSRPLWGTCVHFVAQMLHFHLGVLAVAGPSLRTFAISVFFALLFSGGHLIHELKDLSADRAAGIRTNAVVFGPSRMVVAYRGLTLASAAYWLALYFLGFLPARLFGPFFAAACAHAAFSFAWSSSALAEPRSNQSFQTAYRLFYLLAGCVALF